MSKCCNIAKNEVGVIHKLHIQIVVREGYGAILCLALLPRMQCELTRKIEKNTRNESDSN